MAGNRHHFLPRFLLKGFVSKTRKREKYTFVFTAECKFYETNLINIGLEKHFYGIAGDSEIDDAITQEEERHVAFIEELRKSQSTDLIDAAKSSALIAHLFLRSKCLRELSKEIGDSFLKTMQKNLGGDNDPQQVISDFFQHNRGLLTEKIKEQLPKHLTSMQKKILIQNFFKKQNAWLPGLSEDFQHHFLEPLTQLNKNITNVAKKAHNSVLRKEVVSNKFLQIINNFHWRISFNENQNFILGDVGPIGRFKPDYTYKPLIFYKKDLVQVLLPISSNHLLIGEHPCSFCRIPTVQSLNEASASLSRAFIISKEKTEKELRLASLIGSQSAIVSEDDIKQLEIDIQTGWFGK